MNSRGVTALLDPRDPDVARGAYQNHFDNGLVEMIDIESVGKSDIELLVTLGGDGTLLRVCQLFHNIETLVPPIVPFAMGTLGFLTPFDIENLHPVLDRILSKQNVRTCGSDEDTDGNESAQVVLFQFL